MVWVAPRTWLAGEKLTAAKLNEIRDALKALGDPWTAYSPQWTATTTNPTNYTGTGEYVELGKYITFKARVTANAAGFTPGTGSYRVSLPVAAADGVGARFKVGLLDSSASQTIVGMTFSVAGTIAPIGYVSTATGLLAAVTTTAPFTWAVNDYIELTGTYEAA